MLGLGWSEMLVIGIVLLVVVGPKDLPMMMRNVGRMMGTVRRMGNDFRREIDKAIAADEIAEAKKAISDPLKQTSAEINREFNAIRNGKVEPSGRLQPSEPGKESVVDEIHAQAGMSQSRPEPSAASAALRAKVSESVAKPANAATSAAEQAAPLADTPTAKPKVKAAPRKTAASKTSSKSSAATAETGGKAAGAKPATKPAAKKSAGETAALKAKAPAKARAATGKTATKKAAPTPKSSDAKTGGDQ